MNRNSTDRISSIKVRCNDCDIPEYRDFSDTKEYCIMMPSFMGSGGDGFTMIPNENLSYTQIGSDAEIIAAMTGKMSPLYFGLEGRIQLIDKI